MFIDEINIDVTAGNGGDGHSSFAKFPLRGPDGGNGGDGGSIYVIGTSDLTALARFTGSPHVKGHPGDPGGRNKRTGKNGEDTTIIVPIGTTLTDKYTGQVFAINRESDHLLLAKGGKGGRGNFEFRSSTHQRPKEYEPGSPGHYRKLHVVLKLIAHYGLIGLPNAGKSSLLNELTGAHVKVGSYKFTTLEPNLGVYKKKILADIPGLIEGAHTGKGLGIKFLKHIEKVKTLIHCISAESEDVIRDYKTVRKELEFFSPSLAKKPEIILLTKHDLLDRPHILSLLKKLKRLKTPKSILPVSIHDWDSMEEVKKILGYSIRARTTTAS